MLYIFIYTVKFVQFLMPQTYAYVNVIIKSCTYIPVDWVATVYGECMVVVAIDDCKVCVYNIIYVCCFLKIFLVAV